MLSVTEGPFPPSLETEKVDSGTAYKCKICVLSAAIAAPDTMFEMLDWTPLTNM